MDDSTASVETGSERSFSQADVSDAHRNCGTFFRRLVRGVDLIARRLQKIEEFDTSDDCLLRIGHRHALRELRLPDGTDIRRGNPVIELHLWNEHLAIPPSGIDLGFIAATLRQFERSLALLADHLVQNPSLQTTRAVVITPAFTGRQRQKSLRRFPHLLGGEWMPMSPHLSLLARLHGIADSAWLWLLAWTFNPHSIARDDFFRRREEFWISGEHFVALYSASSVPRRLHVAAIMMNAEASARPPASA